MVWFIISDAKIVFCVKLLRSLLVFGHFALNKLKFKKMMSRIVKCFNVLYASMNIYKKKLVNLTWQQVYIPRK
jgi:hypothetical protein